MSDLVFVGIAKDRGHSGESGDLGGGSLGVAAGDEDLGGGVAGVDAADGSTGGAVGVGGDGAGVEDDELGGFGRSWLEAAVRELVGDGGAVGLRRATTEILDVKSGHRAFMLAEMGRVWCPGWVAQRAKPLSPSFLVGSIPGKERVAPGSGGRVLWSLCCSLSRRCGFPLCCRREWPLGHCHQTGRRVWPCRICSAWARS